MASSNDINQINIPLLNDDVLAALAQAGYSQRDHLPPPNDPEWTQAPFDAFPSPQRNLLKRFAQAPSGGDAVVKAIEELKRETIAKQDEALALLHEQASATVHVSSCPGVKARALEDHCGVTAHVELDLCAGTGPPFSPYDWGNGPEEEDNEVAETEAICEHVREFLSCHGMIGRGKYKVVDIHGQEYKKLLTNNCAAGKFSGTSNIAVVPYKTLKTCAGVRLQLRVLIDVKTRKAINSVGYQPEVELLLSLACSQHPVLVIFSDFATKALVLFMDGRTLYRGEGSPQQAMSKLLAFLADECDPDETFTVPADTAVDALAARFESLRVVKNAFSGGSLVADQLELAMEYPPHERYWALRDIVDPGMARAVPMSLYS